MSRKAGGMADVETIDEWGEDFYCYIDGVLRKGLGALHKIGVWLKGDARPDDSGDDWKRLVHYAFCPLETLAHGEVRCGGDVSSHGHILCPGVGDVRIFPSGVGELLGAVGYYREKRAGGDADGLEAHMSLMYGERWRSVVRALDDEERYRNAYFDEWGNVLGVVAGRGVSDASRALARLGDIRALFFDAMADASRADDFNREFAEFRDAAYPPIYAGVSRAVGREGAAAAATPPAKDARVKKPSKYAGRTVKGGADPYIGKALEVSQNGREVKINKLTYSFPYARIRLLDALIKAFEDVAGDGFIAPGAFVPKVKKDGGRKGKPQKWQNGMEPATVKIIESEKVGGAYTGRIRLLPKAFG